MKYENSKIFFYIFIFFYLLIVSITSLNVGISHDEQHHHEVWLINKKIYSNYFFGDNYEIIFKDFGMNFYGIGFQIFSVTKILVSLTILSLTISNTACLYSTGNIS